jgi:hypothetical protein
MPTGLVVAQAASLSFSGPLPPPAVLQAYDEILEGAAERIFKMAEAQASHRQQLEKSVVTSDIRKSYLGLGAGFLVAALAITGGSVVAYHGQPWARGSARCRTRLGLSEGHERPARGTGSERSTDAAIAQALTGKPW